MKSESAASADAAKRRLPMVGGAAAPTTDFADFQNDVLAGDKSGSHEAAAHEKRNWVRLSYDCNNRCTFCLDSNAHDGTMRDTTEIKVQIVEGRKRGATRLILSGGEPTMHPNFLDFVALGKRAGYPKVQTVTNGRMFKYPEFLERAAKNGLDEITFSLHGHTAKLHDMLVGVPGAFEEESAGLRAALASAKFIVNVDIVINKRNVAHLPDMLDTFIGWGVREFDLLHVIPFGNAWTEARDHLFYDLEENLPHLRKTFAYARRPDIHVWLNRFPPAYTEGFEDLIQDPYKLNDEVRGRREEFDRYLSLGEKLSCREPERCKECYLEPLCDGLDAVLDATRAEEVDRLRVAGPLPRAGRLPRARRALIVAPSVAAAETIARGLPPECVDLELELADFAGLEAKLGTGDALFGRKLAGVRVSKPSDLPAMLALGEAFVVVAMLDRDMAPELARVAPSARLVLRQPNYDRASTARERDVDLAKFLASDESGAPLENVPRCIAGTRAAAEPRTADVANLGGDARVSMPAFTQRFVEDGFYAKPVRCKGCVENARCRGMHVNWVRAHGFSTLQPISG
ncbi:MAG TPA: radical SAM protein [Polyangiaceae bacterium]|nr:radical SAM protein [Polyangiaceae bacterium]